MKSALRAAIACGVISSMIATVARGAEPDAAAPATAAAAKPTEAAKPWRRITISKETTYLTEPLRPDGYVDYVTALERQCSAGVTPENNAAVLLWQAFAYEFADREPYFQALGVPTPPMEGAYFIDESKFVEQQLGQQHVELEDVERFREVAKRQFDIARRRPWSPDEFPLVAEWLAANEAPLAIVVEASHRPRYFTPRSDVGDSCLLAVINPLVHLVRDAAEALEARAMQRLQAGAVDAARDDLRTCHRLARLVDQGASTIDEFCAIIIDSDAFAADAALSHFANLKAEQIRGMGDELARLTPLRPMVDRVDQAERFICLDAIAITARDGLMWISIFSGQSSEPPQDILAKTASKAVEISADWNEPLRMANAWYDRIAEIGRMPNRVKRADSVDAFERDVWRMRAVAFDPHDFLNTYLAIGLRKTLGRKIGQILVGVLLQPIPAFYSTEVRSQACRDMAQIALMLEAWRADHDGTYPAKLDELAPAYLPQLPLDPWSNAPYRYRPEPHGYVVYSVGQNREDEQGRNPITDGQTAEPQWPAGDDIALRMPPREPSTSR